MALSNIYQINEKLNTKSMQTYIDKIEKIDGITLNISTKQGQDVDTAITKIKEACKKLKLEQPTIEKNGQTPTLFAIQFPNLNVEYNSDELKTIMTQIITWSINNIKQNDYEGVINRDAILFNKGVIIKHCIVIFVNNNVNLYKERASDYLNNTEFRKTVDEIFMDVLDKFKFNK